MSTEAIPVNHRREPARLPSRSRSGRFALGLLLATVAAGLLAWVARTGWLLPVDVKLTHAIQAIEGPWLVTFLHAVGWIGFPPQCVAIYGAAILVLFLLGLRLEAAMTVVAAVGGAALWYVIPPLVDRPRPSPELVRVAVELPTASFPSGHALNMTAIFGFLLFLAIILVKDVRWRWVLAVLLVVPILTIGVARIYDGAHWPSDVLGGYLIGGIWLGLTILLYRWANARFSGANRPHARAAAYGRSR